jgi:hypothetical protein
MTPRQALPLLRCFAAEVPLGLPAEEVLEFMPADPGIPHIADLLGMPPGPPAASQRSLRLCDGAGGFRVNVDGPVLVRRLGAAEILPLPPFFLRTSIQPVIGFAHEDGRVVLLLDVASVVRRADRPGPRTAKGSPP